MGAHPNATRRHLAQQRIEIGAVASFVNRVDPNEYAIARGEPCADGVDDVVLVHDRVCIDANIGKRSENGLKPAGLGRGAAAHRFIAAP
jgi:hypothetical protein